MYLTSFPMVIHTNDSKLGHWPLNSASHWLRVDLAVMTPSHSVAVLTCR